MKISIYSIYLFFDRLKDKDLIFSEFFALNFLVYKSTQVVDLNIVSVSKNNFVCEFFTQVYRFQFQDHFVC